MSDHAIASKRKKKKYVTINKSGGKQTKNSEGGMTNNPRVDTWHLLALHLLVARL